MRCKSVQRRLTSEERRLSTHLAFFPWRSLRRGMGRVPESASFSGSSLMDFTGLSVLPLRFWEFVLLRMGGYPLVLSCVADAFEVSPSWVGISLIRHGSTSASPQQAVEILVL